jgi:predicted secreted protein
MRPLLLAVLVALTACATISESGPSLRYADAASRGAWASLLAGRPTEAQVERTTALWSNALGDSFACDVRMRDVINAGLVGALEIGAMNAAASRGGEAEVREGVGRYVATLAGLAVQRRETPSATRCETLSAWAPRIAGDGREAVERARRNGLMEDEYGLLLALLAR